MIFEGGAASKNFLHEEKQKAPSPIVNKKKDSLYTLALRNNFFDKSSKYIINVLIVRFLSIPDESKSRINTYRNYTQWWQSYKTKIFWIQSSIFSDCQQVLGLHIGLAFH